MSHINRVNGPGYVGYDHARADQEDVAIVRLGERRWSQLAQRLGVSEQALRDANPRLRRQDLLSPGQEIALPPQQERLAAEQLADQIEAEVKREIKAEVRQQVRARLGDAPKQPEEITFETPFGIARRKLSPLPEQTAAERIEQSVRGEQRISREGWTQQMLTKPFTADFLKRVSDPSDFVKARLDLLDKPTNARAVNTRTGAWQALSPAQMSTIEQAQELLAHLRSIGVNGNVREQAPYAAPYTVDYRGDNRRHYHIDYMNVGQIARRYAQYPVEVADPMVLAEARVGRVSNT